MKIELGLIAAIQAALVGLAGWLFKDMKERLDKVEKATKSEEEIRQMILDLQKPLEVEIKEVKEDVKEIKSDVKELIKRGS